MAWGCASLDALVRLWILVEQPTWGLHLRSAAQVRRSTKRHLADSSLAAAATGATPKSLIADSEAFGQLFESLVSRDLSVYAQTNNARVFAYQNNRGAQIDAVVLMDNIWAAFEVKLSANRLVVDNAAGKPQQIAGRCAQLPPS